MNFVRRIDSFSKNALASQEIQQPAGAYHLPEIPEEISLFHKRQLCEPAFAIPFFLPG